MSAANYHPIHIPITGGTLTIRPDDAGPEDKIRIEIVTSTGAQTLFIDASCLDLLQEQICSLLAATNYAAAG
jgi:hypothetical protein